MNSILQACQPRPDLLGGSFNPEVFTASLRQVVGHYRGEVKVETAYTDAETFFREATSPTEGMQRVIEHVLRRLAGDNLVPFLSRLETGFGGGKTHTLIACTHLARRGTELRDTVTSMGLVEPEHLPEPGSVTVVGVAGDVVDVVTTRGEEVLPYTLWAEMAKQVGGEALLQEVSAEAFSPAAPGESFFKRVLGDRKVLILVDELAQYAARASAAQRGMGEQIAAFFMGLFNYARNNTGIAIVLTLASSTDAFAGQTKALAQLLQQASGDEISQDQAREIGEEAIEGITSVIARDAKVETPVTGEELSSVLAKRLFVRIDENAAAEVASVYRTFYAKHKDHLPPRATRESGASRDGGGYADLVAKYYPFHPTLVEFLNKKLATAEDFQGTRGVLRVLAFAVKSLWENGDDMESIQTCHLDTTNPDLVNEILGKTESGDLKNVLTADVGAVRGRGDTLHARSNAENADAENPHPHGLPMQVYVWRTVFLHSLVGRRQGVGSSLFGLTQEEARLESAQPQLPPSQVDTALAELARRAFYLRHQDGRYFASLEPSVNKALAQIRDGVSDEDLQGVLEAAARKVVSNPVPTFTVHQDVASPEDLPDNQDKPMLGVVSLFAENLAPDKFVQTERRGSPRVQQNLVFLLAPNTVATTLPGGGDDLYGNDQIRRNLRELRSVARDVVAMRRLQKNPQNYSIEPRHLTDEASEESFPARRAEREQALNTRVTESYRTLWYPSATGQVVRKEVQTAGGEGGTSVIARIREALIEDQELITEEQLSVTLLKQFKPLFFGKESICRIAQLRKNFRDRRTWPILAEPHLLDRMIRDGVAKGLWCVYLLGEPSATRPAEFYSRETDGVPLAAELGHGDYALVTPEGAAQRGWSVATAVPFETVRDWVGAAVNNLTEPGRVDELVERLTATHGEVDVKDVHRAVAELARAEQLAAKPSTGGKAAHGSGAMMYTPEADDLVLPVSRAVEKEWIQPSKKLLKVDGFRARDTVFPALKRLSSLYTRGATSRIDQLRIERLPLKSGGQLTISLTGLEPAQIKTMGGMFDSIATLGEPTDDTQITLTILDPAEGCLFVKELKA